ncbi:DnaJ domain-containing protein [Methanolobus sp. ZRKC3]|uniref:J domain-containing protein n=1 Tax=Methanolobus sp. ZRKC3 TaxID=3125786 RepID=UPI003244B360
MIDYYKVLGVLPDSSADEIRRRYRELISYYHPDINSDPSAGARTQEITEAYSVLSDSEKRAAYNRRLFGGGFSRERRYQSGQERYGQTNNSNAKQSNYGDYVDPEKPASEGLFDKFLKIIGMLAVLWILLRRPTIVVGILLTLLLLYILWRIFQEIFWLLNGKK